jgi:hypothetical protein
MTWTIVVDGEYVHISKDDQHGVVTVKADAEGYVADIWNTAQTDCIATCAAPYSELEIDEQPVAT